MKKLTSVWAALLVTTLSMTTLANGKERFKPLVDTFEAAGFAEVAVTSNDDSSGKPALVVTLQSPMSEVIDRMTAHARKQDKGGRIANFELLHNVVEDTWSVTVRVTGSRVYTFTLTGVEGAATLTTLKLTYPFRADAWILDERAHACRTISDIWLRPPGSENPEEGAGAQFEIATQFVEQFEKVEDEHKRIIFYLARSFQKGTPPVEFDFDEFKKSTLTPIKELCKAYLRDSERPLTVPLAASNYDGILSPLLAEAVFTFQELRYRVEVLSRAIEALEYFEMGEAMPRGVSPTALVHAYKDDQSKETVPTLDGVEIAKGAKAELHKEVRTAGTGKANEKEAVREYRTILVTDSHGESRSVRVEHLFKINLKPYLIPLLSRAEDDQKARYVNLSTLLFNLSGAMEEVSGASDLRSFGYLRQHLKQCRAGLD